MGARGDTSERRDNVDWGPKKSEVTIALATSATDPDEGNVR